MAKKVTKKAAANDATPAVDPVPAVAATQVSKPRATAIPRAAKPTVPTVPAAASPGAITDQMIAECAYHMWKNGQPGDHQSHWHAAERELRNGR